LRYYHRLQDLDGFAAVAAERIKSSGCVVDTLEAVVWSLITTDGFEQALLNAVNLGDDSDTVGSVTGGLAGLYAKKSGYNNNRKQILIIFLICEILICLLNTIAIYADSKIFGYYYPTIITGMIAIRMVTAVGKGIVLGIVSTPLLKALSKVTGNGRKIKTGN
jgi:hypothetical protein